MSLLQRQRFIEYKTTRPSETAHGALLLAVWHEFVFKSLKSFHKSIILWSMEKNNDIRRGRHCVFNMHVHLVFVTKYRRDVFTKAILNDLQEIFASVCADFEAELATANATIDSKDGVAVRASHPRPKRRGFPRILVTSISHKPVARLLILGGLQPGIERQQPKLSNYPTNNTITIPHNVKNVLLTAYGTV